jgi:hypothetical protein
MAIDYVEFRENDFRLMTHFISVMLYRLYEEMDYPSFSTSHYTHFIRYSMIFGNKYVYD